MEAGTHSQFCQVAPAVASSRSQKAMPREDIEVVEDYPGWLIIQAKVALYRCRHLDCVVGVGRLGVRDRRERNRPRVTGLPLHDKHDRTRTVFAAFGFAGGSFTLPEVGIGDDEASLSSHD